MLNFSVLRTDIIIDEIYDTPSFAFVLASPMSVERVMLVEGVKFYGTRTARTVKPVLRVMFHHCLPSGLKQIPKA